MEKIISIIVPVYNVEDFLDECIKSIVGQTYKNIEVILIDDGSTDNSPAICDKWASEDSRIKVVHQQNQGVSTARNRGISLSTGDYVYFVDSDDYIDLNLCQVAINALNKDQSDIVVFGFCRVTEQGKLLVEEPWKNAVLNRENALKELFSGEMRSYPCNKIFNRKLWSGVEFPVGRVFEDIGTIYKVFLEAEKISCIEDMLYYYRKRASSIIGEMKTTTLRDLFYIRKSVYDDMMTINPQIAKLSYKFLVENAMAYIDRSFWSETDLQSIQEANNFLQENKTEVCETGVKEAIFYLKHPRIYRVYRLSKHMVGNIVKAIIK